MKTIYNLDIISEFKNIKPGEIVIVNSEKCYIKITDGVDAELLNLIDGSIIEPKPADAQVSHIKWCSMVSPPYLWLLHPQIQRVTALRVYCLQSQNTVVQK